MKCKFCPKEIDYVAEEKVAYELDGNKHDCPGLKNKPKGFPKKWVKKEYKPMEGTLDKAAIDSQINALDERVGHMEEAIRALVQQLSFQKASSEEVANESAELLKKAMVEKPDARPKDEKK